MDSGSDLLAGDKGYTVFNLHQSQESVRGKAIIRQYRVLVRSILCRLHSFFRVRFVLCVIGGSFCALLLRMESASSGMWRILCPTSLRMPSAQHAIADNDGGNQADLGRPALDRTSTTKACAIKARFQVSRTRSLSRENEIGLVVGAF